MCSLTHCFELEPIYSVRYCHSNQKIFAMRLCIVFLVLVISVAVLPCRAAAQTPVRITITVTEQPLELFFQQLEKQTGYTIYYPTDMLDPRQRVTFSFQDATLADVMKVVLKGKGLTWQFDKKSIYIARPEPSRVPADSAAVRGTVVDTTGSPLAGASVQIEGAAAGDISGTDGTFSVRALPPVTLTVTCVGFARQQYRVVTGVPVQIVLVPEVKGLDEQLVIGYGVTSKRYGLGSVAKVAAAALAAQPVANPLQGLQGRTAGVIVTTHNGLPGGNVSVLVRGRNTVSAGTTPLYIVDGVPVQGTPFNAGAADFEGASGLTSPLATVNPADIESIEILKDADATAIYGSRGANGVVMITTKKGKAGKTRATVGVTAGVSRIASRVNYLSLPQYLLLRNEAFANDSIVPTAANAPELKMWDTTKTTDWQDYIFGGSAPLLELMGSVEGGSGGTNFLLSGSHRTEGIILPGDNSYRRSGVHLSVGHSSKDKRFGLQSSASYYSDAIDVPRNTALASIATLPPHFPVFDTEGHFNFTGISIHPLAALRQRAFTKTDNLTASATLRYNVSRSVTLKLGLGHTVMTQRQVMTLPRSGQNPASNPVNSAFFSNTSAKSLLAEPQLEFRRRWGIADVQVLAGGTWQQTDRITLRTRGDDYINESLMGTINNAGTIGYARENYIGYRYLSGFGRVSLRLAGKYLANLSFRRDGSTRFGPANRFGNFGALGLGYIFSEEPIVRDALPWLTFGKIRASYGVTGNDQITDYQYMESYTTGGIYQGVATLQPARLSNPDYSWERNKKFEVAGEFTFFNCLSLTVVRYQNNCDNQLVPFPTPAMTGFISYQANIPAKVRNSGWEAEININPAPSRRVSWNAGVNLTVPKTVLLSYPGLAGSSYATLYEIGQDLQITRGFRFLGVDPKTGIATFEDKNGDTAITGPQDYFTFGTRSPRFYGGITGTVNIGRLELGLAVQFVSQYAPGFGYIPGGYANTYTEALNRWQRPGDQTTVPRATTTPGNPAFQAISKYTLSDRIMHRDASFIRLKTMSAAWLLPAGVAKRIGMESVRLHCSAQNLLTITRRDRRDPESNNDGIPPLATLVAGIKLSF